MALVVGKSDRESPGPSAIRDPGPGGHHRVAVQRLHPQQVGFLGLSVRAISAMAH